MSYLFLMLVVAFGVSLDSFTSTLMITISVGEVKFLQGRTSSDNKWIQNITISSISYVSHQGALK